MRRHIPLLLILLMFLSIGFLYARLTPAWQAPDEPAHYNYVRQLAAGSMPVMEPGDYDQEYIEEVVFESAFDPAYAIEPISYEDWQPPLYYMLQTPLYEASSGSLMAMRLLSLLMGAGTIILAYAITLRIAPSELWLALTAAVFVAFLPQHMALMASLNNDALAELLIAAALFLIVDTAMPDAAHINSKLLLLGIVLGLGFLTKGSVYILAIVAALVLVWRYWGERRELIRAGLLVYTPALLLGALWWGRNLAVYGGIDVMGKGRHDMVVVGQPRTAEWIARFGYTGTIERFLQTTFNSFWGQFGWMTVPMTYPSWLYPMLWVFTGIVIAGVVWTAVSNRKNLKQYGAPIVALPALLLLTALVYAGYNIQFVQHQGRYLFPALIPIAIGLAIGLGLWARPLRRRWPWMVYAIPLGLAIFLIALDLYALFYAIIPALA
ncbi:MAG: phospholipid carrier-dependent glycosyltransferase [Candidatus Promineifilaceae bacterium]